MDMNHQPPYTIKCSNLELPWQNIEKQVIGIGPFQSSNLITQRHRSQIYI